MAKLRHLETDVIVVGGGGSGLAAALAASDQGADVILLEKRPQLGGTTGIAVGSFTAAGTSLQRAGGLTDDPSHHAEDIGKFAPQHERKNNAKLRARLAAQAAETFEWLRGLGLDFGGPNPEPPNRIPRMHNVVPNAKMYIAVCQRRAMERGVEILVNHRAMRLLRESDGRVVGLEAAGPGGEVIRMKARRGIILAAGDYSSGDSLKEEFVPDIAAIDGINPHAGGDGHRLAREVGASLVNMDLIYGPEIRFIPPPREPFTQLLPAERDAAREAIERWDSLGDEEVQRRVGDMLVTWQHPEDSLYEKGAVLVNHHGRRFVNETSRPELAIPRQPDKIAYLIFDQRVADIFSNWPHFVSTAPGIGYAYVEDYKRLRPDLYSEAPTLEGLGDRISVDASTLEATVRDFNEAVEGVADDPFGRSSFGAPIATPPFYALGPAKSWIVTTEGGVRINDDCAVLDADARVIPGLFAAGSNGMGGLVLWGHGLHIAWAFTSGRIAGRSAGRMGGV